MTLCRIMEPPTEQELKQTGIGKLINKVQKKEQAASKGKELSRLGTLAKDIVDYWKNLCKSMKEQSKRRSRSRSPQQKVASTGYKGILKKSLEVEKDKEGANN